MLRDNLPLCGTRVWDRIATTRCGDEFDRYLNDLMADPGENSNSLTSAFGGHRYIQLS